MNNTQGEADNSSPTPGLALDDIGLLQGVVVVDRLRTLGGQLLDVEQHLARFRQSANSLGIILPNEHQLKASVLACVNADRERYQEDDFSIIMLATPGRVSSPIIPATRTRQPTLIFHTQAIDWRRLASWYTAGQALQISPQRSVPETCWSPKIKTRARLQYYLADQQAIKTFNDPYAAGLLCDTHNYLTETSYANVLLVEGERLVSPQPNGILDGISLTRTLRLASLQGIQVHWEDITIERAKQADAILLCGSTGCLWNASRLDDRTFGPPHQCDLLLRLQQAWIQEVQCDFIEQALAAAKR